MTSHALLTWYDAHRRVFPWRAQPGARPNPYAVWLSEIMLQQTTTATVASYYERFLRRWPDVNALAAAGLDEVLSAWAGLGYYRRARYLHACAVIVAREHGGRFPDDEAALRALPGIGRYTAAAIAAIAFDRPSVVVDGNVERVMARRFALVDDKAIHAAMARQTPRERPGDFAQGVMDLGATICTPRQPRCPACPWRGDCRAFKEGRQGEFPVKAKKKARPVRHAIAFVMLDRSGAVWLRRRPDSGILAGMTEVPTTPWTAAPPRRVAPPAKARWRVVPGTVRHVFTHLDLRVTVRRGESAATPDGTGFWLARDRLAGAALPALFRKVLAHAGVLMPSPRAKPATRRR